MMILDFIRTYVGDARDWLFWIALWLGGAAVIFSARYEFHGIANALRSLLASGSGVVLGIALVTLVAYAKRDRNQG